MNTPQNQNQKQQLMNERDAAKFLDICPRNLWGRRKRGEIPCVRIGRRVMYDPADLRAYIESSKQLAC